MPDKVRFSLDDLNELSDGLGNRICTLLDGHDNWWACQAAEKEIDTLLAANKLEADDVLVNKGRAEGFTIKVAFANAANYYQFQDQLDA